MTAATLASLPLQVGGEALVLAGRATLVLVQRYMRSPLTNSAIAALVVTTAMAGSNALWGQQREHPSPMFAPATAVMAEVAPVFPRTRPKSFAVGTPKVPAKLAEVPAATTKPIGNKDVAEVQTKLEAMKLFSGTVDGYYGPQTARAIKQFQEMQGLKATGTLDREIIERILATPRTASVPTPAVEPIVAAEPPAERRQPVVVTLPEEIAPVEVEPPAAKPNASTEVIAPRALAALPKPAPLTADIETGSIGNPKAGASVKVLGRPVPTTPEAALEMAANTANEAIDTIIGGVESLAETKPVSFSAGSKPLTTAEAAAPIELKPTVTVVAEEKQQLAALPDSPKVGVPLIIDEAPPKPGEAIAVLDTDATPDEIKAPFSVTDPVIVAKVQRGLGSLGFLHGPADGFAGEATAKAIRNFEVYFNYRVTGRISPELLDLLVDNGASI